MPLYEYYCSDCRSKFEVLTSYEASQGSMVCATCHGANVRKLLSVFARRSRGGDGDDFGDFSDGDYGDDGGEDFGGGGGCSCGGACGCNN
ncbi:MAG TPA: FmdB family zinc ribbon protein [Ktedonobacterales bacterium]